MSGIWTRQVPVPTGFLLLETEGKTDKTGFRIRQVRINKVPLYSILNQYSIYSILQYYMSLYYTRQSISFLPHRTLQQRTNFADLLLPRLFVICKFILHNSKVKKILSMDTDVKGIFTRHFVILQSSLSPPPLVSHLDHMF